MSESAKKDYQVTTNARALSRVREILKSVEIDEIPVLDLGEDMETFVSIIEIELSKDANTFNGFFRAITKSEDDFVEMPMEVCHKVAMDFFKILPSVFINTIMKSLKELKRQKSSVIAQNMEAMKSVMEKKFNEEFEKAKIDTENIV